LAHEREQHRRQGRVDTFVAAHASVAEVEEGLPVDEPARGAMTAPKIVRIGTGRQRRIEHKREELLRGIGGAGAEVGPIAGADLRVPEAVGGDGELDGMYGSLCQW
jgi:hypothetical protein